MAWIKVIDEESAVGELKSAYGRVMTTRGGVSNIFKVQSLDPKSLQAHLDLYLSIMFGSGRMTRKERELIAVVVSAENHCPYCVKHHSEALGRYVKDAGSISRLAANPREAPLEPRERAMVDYALALTKDSHSMTRKAIEELRLRGMSDEEILQLNLVASYFNFVNRVANGLGVALEEDRLYRY